MSQNLKVTELFYTGDQIYEIDKVCDVLVQTGPLGNKIAPS